MDINSDKRRGQCAGLAKAYIHSHTILQDDPILRGQQSIVLFLMNKKVRRQNCLPKTYFRYLNKIVSAKIDMISLE